ncbi:MAG: DamX protein [Alphaproteobacteria bacterium]|jgi:DamX protein
MVNVSELHKRLSHLVNYSSQLIFVSGDSIADQQKTLSEFLSSQQENTEVSFFSASKSKQASVYRGSICRQLCGHEVGSFVRPLQQLLSDPTNGLSNQSGSYLVCITQAEALDSSFLQELWDWVMHAQQTSPGIHLNIILFGESSWAKKSQEWLPMQNSHKPVLLSSELVNPVGFDVNALEALMADKSSWFSASNQPLVTNKWFISSVLSVFLVVFVSLMAWQYPAQFSSLISGDDETLSTLNTPVGQAESKTDHSTENTVRNIDEKREAIVDETFTVTSRAQNIYQQQLEVVDSKVNGNVEVLDISASIDNLTSIESTSVTDTLLVSNWSDSVAASKQRINAAVDSPKRLLSNDSIDSIPEVASNTDGDFQVPDIISVEQLDAQFSSNQDTNLVLALNTNPETSPQLQQIPKTSLETQQIAIVSTSTIDYQFDETTLLLLPTDSVVLQLSGIQNPLVLENYLNNNNLKASTWVYETQRYGGPWYVVLYRQSFESTDAALNQLASLPADVKEAQPFAKSINQIQQEISLRAYL